MSDHPMPEDPAGENEWAVDDESVAIGLACLDSFANGAHVVVVTKRPDGSYNVIDDTDDGEAERE